MRPRGSTSAADLSDALVAEPAAKFQHVVEKPQLELFYQPISRSECVISISYSQLVFSPSMKPKSGRKAVSLLKHRSCLCPQKPAPADMHSCLSVDKET